MHGLGFRLALAAVAIVAAGAWYHQGRDAQAASAAAEPQIELELPGLTVPASQYGALSAQAGAQLVLAPSCDVNAPGACDRLQAICANLQGALTDNQNGSLTCLIVLN